MKGKITYRQQYTRCGKERCRKCREGEGHGPYWYAYWSDKGRTISKYIGVHLPEEIRLAQQLPEAPDEEKEQQESQEGRGSISSGPVLRISILGQFRIERQVGSEWITVDSRIWHRRRARALLGCLLSQPGRRLGREQVIDLLWPELDIDVAANRLHGAVHELRQILEPEIERPAASRLLRMERDILELADQRHVWVDVDAFEQLLKEANASVDAQHIEQLLEESDALYKGSYLIEEMYAEWAIPRRDALHRAWVGLLLELAEIQAERGALIAALEILSRLRAADKTNETALQRLMILLTILDRRGEALQIYRKHVNTLELEFEGEPLPETISLYERISKGQTPQLPKTGRSQNSTSLARGSRRQAQDMGFSRPIFQLNRHNQSKLIGRQSELNIMHRVMLTIENATPKKNSPDTPGETLLTVSSTRPQHPHFLVLRGDAGIGKTRLAEELSLEAYSRGWAVAWSRSYEQERTIPYRPWTELLRILLQGTALFTEIAHGVASSSQLAPSLLKLDRLSMLLPELQALTHNARPTAPLPYEQERLNLWEAALSVLGTLSKTHPLLLILDDLHWTDESSIELLTYLTHHLRDQRILILATCRDGETPLHRLHTLISDLIREQAIVTLPIKPLTQSQISTMLAHLPRDIVQNIQSQAAGNPFFAEELARYVGPLPDAEFMLPATTSETPERSQISHPSRPPSSPQTSRALAPFEQFFTESESTQITSPSPVLPDGIAAVLERRLSKLNGDCQMLLSKAAVLGGSFELRQLLPMASEHTEDSIYDLLDEALRAGLLIEEGSGSHIIYHFWHPLIISHLYERLSAARRAYLHRKAAEALKETQGKEHLEKVAAAIVYHLVRGGGEAAQVASYAELAGNQAYTLAEYSEARQYYLLTIQALQSMIGKHTSKQKHLHLPESTEIHQLIQLITSHPFKTSQVDALHMCRLLEYVAECSMIQGNFEEARNLYTHILELRTSEDFLPSIVGENSTKEQLQQEAQIQALLWRELGNAWVGTSDYERAYECYGRGTAVLSKADIISGTAWAYLHLQYGDMLRLEGSYLQARHYLQEALEMLECTISPQSPSQVTSSHTNLLPVHMPQESQEALRLQTRIERTLHGDSLQLGFAHERLGIVAASTGQFSEGLVHLHTALSIYEQSDLVSEMTRVCSNLGAAYVSTAKLEAARTYLQRALKLGERTGNLPHMGVTMHNLGDAMHRTGDLQASQEWYNRCITIFEPINRREGICCALAELATVYQDLGSLDQAAASIQRAISLGRAIKSARSIRTALITESELRITEAISASLFQSSELSTDPKQASYSRRLLVRTRARLQKILSLEGVEIEILVEGKFMLATVYHLLDDREKAKQLALHALEDTQQFEITRTTGRIYCLLGRILFAQNYIDQGSSYFEQAITIFRASHLRLDYARALYHFGLALIVSVHPHIYTNQSIHYDSSAYQRGFDYLHEARRIFDACHAATDLSWVEHALAQYEVDNIRITGTLK